MTYTLLTGSVVNLKKEIESNSKLHYHWYNKSGLGDRRKVGHVTAVLDTETERDEMIDVLSPLVK